MNDKKFFPWRSISLIIVSVALTLLFLSPAAGQNESSNEQCEITLREIVADNSGGEIDPALKDITKDLKKLAYSSYRLEQTSRLTMRKGEKKIQELLGKNRLELTNDGLEEGKVRLKVKLSPDSGKEKSLETTMRVPDGYTFIIAGPAYGGGVLFLAFTTKF
ncbi:MAG TPA: hypothetical protein VM123_11100 [archaeon]|nr:hypothetical protein [archaeon]